MTSPSAAEADNAVPTNTSLVVVPTKATLPEAVAYTAVPTVIASAASM